MAPYCKSLANNIAGGDCQYAQMTSDEPLNNNLRVFEYKFQEFMKKDAMESC